MANDSPEAEYRNARKRLDDKYDQGEVPTDDYELITEFLDAIDPQIVTVGNGDTKAYSTLKSYCYRLLWSSVRIEDTTLAEATHDNINQLMSDFLTGRNKHVKEGGMANKTVRLYQSALRSFYHYHDLNTDPEKIAYAERPDSKVDERDMFSKEDIEAMRDACPNPRDRCIIELLLNTGQRIRALQTLRIKDIDLDNGVFYLNVEEAGLKGAEGKRPLLAARAAVRDWLDYHPTGESDHYLITGLHDYNRGEGDVLTRQHIRRRLKKIADEAGVEKPVNPHQWRHYCVTMLKRDYNLDNDTIKWLIGHASDSRVMETTYSHLTDEDYIEKAEVATEVREETTESPLTPARCPTCDNPLSSDAKACGKCGEVFTPDAKATKDQFQENFESEIPNIESKEEAKFIQAVLKDLRENPDYVLED